MTLMNPEMQVLLYSKSGNTLHLEFFNSMRGQLIISQALYVASRALSKEEFPETSNIKDMEYLLEHCFPIFPVIQNVIE